MTGETHHTTGPHLGSGRRRLTPEGIIATAVELIDQQGLPAFTMRSLAVRLKADPSAVYRHFRNKDELLGRVADALLTELQPAESPDGDVDWRESARRLAHHLRELLRRQPGLLLVITSAPVTMNAATFTANLLRALHDAGLSRVRAQQALSTLLSFIVGFAALEAGQPPSGMPPGTDPSAVAADRSDVALSTEFWWPARDIADRRFAEGLDLILSAISSRAEDPVHAPDPR